MYNFGKVSYYISFTTLTFSKAHNFLLSLENPTVISLKKRKSSKWEIMFLPSRPEVSKATAKKAPAIARNLL